MTRSMMRGATALAASAAVAAGLLLAGCGAGQVTQTENQQPPISGVNVDSPDHKILLRNLAVVYAGPEGYARGSAAPLQVRIINQNQETVRLVAVTTDAGTVVLAGPGAVPSSAAASPPAPSSAPPSASGSPSVSAGRSGSPSVSGSPSAPASPTASPTPSGPPVNRQISVEITTRAMAILDPGSQRYLQITGLSEELRPGRTVMLTFRFDNGVEIETPVPIAVPLSPLPRSPMDLEEHE